MAAVSSMDSLPMKFSPRVVGMEVEVKFAFELLEHHGLTDMLENAAPRYRLFRSRATGI